MWTDNRRERSAGEVIAEMIATWEFKGEYTLSHATVDNVRGWVIKLPAEHGNRPGVERITLSEAQLARAYAYALELTA